MKIKIVLPLLIILTTLIFIAPVFAQDCYCSSCSDCMDKLNNASCTTVYLTADIINYEGTCINNPAGFTNKTFDCQSHLIDGIGFWNSYGIYLNGKTNNTIKNCRITEFYNGIRLDSSSNNNITNNTMNNNDYGIYLYSSSNNNIINNNTVNNNNYYGIHLDSSSNNNLTNNTANNNNDYGIYLYSSSNNNIINNNTVNNNNYDGICLSYSSNNNITNNTAKENSMYDLEIWADSNTHCNNIIENNTGSGDRPIKYFNDTANLENEILSELILCNADGSSINNITIEGSDTLMNNGVLVFFTDNSNFTNINSSNNCDGIHLASSSNNNIINNTASNNNNDYGYGIYLESSSNNNLTNNIANNNYCGISPSYNSNNNNLKNNIANNNADSGIYLESSSNNTLTSNIANLNNFNGIVLCNSNNNNLTNNTANNNAYGIFLSSSSNNTLTNNTVNNNDEGIYLDSSSNNNITNNTANNNTLYAIYLSRHSHSNNFTYNTICWNGEALSGEAATNIIEYNTFCVDILSPANNKWYSSFSNFLFNVSNPLFETSCQLYVDSILSGVNSSIYNNEQSNITNTSVSQGLHEIYIYCNDSMSNSGNSSLYVFGIKKSDGSSCTTAEECLGGYCCSGKCRSSPCPTAGGGRGRAPTPTVVVVVKKDNATITISSIAKDKSFEVNLNNTLDTGLNKINILVKKVVSNAKVIIEELTTLPIAEPEGIVYRNFEIKKENIADADIDKAIFEFSVEKSWIDENKLDPGTIALQRYTTGWEKLPTTKISESATEIVFEAESPGLSYFAITGKTIELKEEISKEVSEEEKTPVKKANLTWLWIVIAIVIILILLVVVYKKLKK